MKYLCRVRHKFNDYEVGEELILTTSELFMWGGFVKVLKKIKERPLMVRK
jgi:hypothetical protein